jgi:flagellar protein FliO/FliZ
MEDVSVLSLLGRLVFSLAVVLVLMALVARVMRNRTMPGVGRVGARRDVLQIVARQPLSRAASVAVVRAADRAMVLGITDHGIELLAELDPATLEDDDAGSPTAVAPPTWQGIVDAFRDRTVRRS